LPTLFALFGLRVFFKGLDNLASQTYTGAKGRTMGERLIFRPRVYGSCTRIFHGMRGQEQEFFQHKPRWGLQTLNDDKQEPKGVRGCLKTMLQLDIHLNKTLAKAN
jgi:hypothetical protein